MKASIVHIIRFWGIRIIITTGILMFLFLAYFFYNSSVNIAGYQLNNPVYHYTENLEWWLHTIIYFTIISFLSSAASIILSFYFIKKQDYIEKAEKRYEILFTKKLIEYIYSDGLDKSQAKTNYDSFFNVVIHSKLAKEVFFSLIIKLQLLTTKNINLKLNTLVEKAGLTSSYDQFLYSFNKSERIIAVKIISYLKVDEHKEAFIKYLKNTNGSWEKRDNSKISNYKRTISKYMNSNNLTLRNEATTALIRLSDAKNLALLLSKRQHISRLGINTIVNTVEETNKKDINYKAIINSPNPRVAAIGVLLAKSHNKIEYKDLIKAAIMRKRVLLHEIAWEAYAHFSNTNEDLEFMLESFKDETSHSKLSILGSLRKFTYNNRLAEFLDNVIKNEDVEMKITALKLLFEVDMGLLFSYKNSSDKKVVDAYKEITDLTIF